MLTNRRPNRRIVRCELNPSRNRGDSTRRRLLAERSREQWGSATACPGDQQLASFFTPTLAWHLPLAHKLRPVVRLWRCPGPYEKPLVIDIPISTAIPRLMCFIANPVLEDHITTSGINSRVTAALASILAFAPGHAI
ncbi:uncharacterized protein BDV14DRAFT_31677 [Aspergillus stella-maris]|uniref:uncharacterized protein n=1 Tax=Aspergillus stella-maris TaxID=1810926 RepID=UPI003CCD99D7